MVQESLGVTKQAEERKSVLMKRTLTVQLILLPPSLASWGAIRGVFGDVAVPISLSRLSLSRSRSLSRATASMYSPTSAVACSRSLDDRVKARNELNDSEGGDEKSEDWSVNCRWEPTPKMSRMPRSLWGRLKWCR
jgi:hypothetical protein